MLTAVAHCSHLPINSAPLPAAQVTTDADRALHALQSSIAASEATPVSQVAPASVLANGERDAVAWPLPSLPEDPLNQSTFSMASSGGLIAWSKALQREEENSPPATLASFFRA